jgi:hypothetical protein
MALWQNELRANPAVNGTLRDEAAQRPVTSTLDARNRS